MMWHAILSQYSIFLPQFLILAATTCALILLPRLLSWIQKLRTWRAYCASHSSFSKEAGQGKHLWLEDPWSKSNNYWLCHHAAIKHVFSRSAIPQTDHRAGFDWFHYAGWEVPTMDPRYKTTVRVADQTVHGKLAKSKLKALLETVQTIGYAEIDRIKDAVGSDGRVISLHSQLYRLGYNVNCIGIFGKDLDWVATRIALQNFTERQHEMFNSFNWPLPLCVSTRLSAGARRTVRARGELYKLMLSWYQSGGMLTASPELRAISSVFEDTSAPADVNAKFMNMMMIAFLANTPETLGWLFTHITQSPLLFARIREECDALLSSVDGLAHINFKQATPYLYSAFFETFRMYVFTGTPATVIKECRLPGMGDKVFKKGDILHSMGAACAMDEEVYGKVAGVWRGDRFVGEGERLLGFDLTFGIGRSPCPGRNFAIDELCMLAARLVQVFDYSQPGVAERLQFDDEDWKVRKSAAARRVDVIDLDGTTRSIIHPGNGSDSGPPGMTAANVPMHDFTCKLTPRHQISTMAHAT